MTQTPVMMMTLYDAVLTFSFAGIEEKYFLKNELPFEVKNLVTIKQPTIMYVHSVIDMHNE